MVVALVEKQYREDIDEAAAYDYRYWNLVLTIDGREFGVRIYADDTDKAYLPISPRPVDDAQHADLRALAEYLREHEGVRELCVIGDSGGYEELEAAIATKRARA